MIKTYLIFSGLLVLMLTGTYFAPHEPRVGNKLAIHKERIKDIKTSHSARRGSIFFYYYRSGGYRGGGGYHGGK